jgi:hypothetical protein
LRKISLYDKKHGSKIKFTTVRNPLSWYTSWYFYAYQTFWGKIGPEWKTPLHKITKQLNTKDLMVCFPYWLCDLLHLKGVFKQPLQSKWYQFMKTTGLGLYSFHHIYYNFSRFPVKDPLTQYDELFIPDAVITMENMHEELEQLLKAPNLPRSVINEGQYGSYVDYYNDETIRLVKAKDRLFFDRYYTSHTIHQVEP